VAVQLARHTGGGVNYWMELPIAELLQYMFEVADQLQKEHDALERKQRR